MTAILRRHLAVVPGATAPELSEWLRLHEGQVFRLRAIRGDACFQALGPEDEACRVAINVTSRAPDPIRLISNFAPTPFVLDGLEYGSVEGFWQGLKFPDQAKRRELALLHGSRAKDEGFRAPAADTFAYGGATVRVGTWDHWQLMERACTAKFEQHAQARDALLSTGERPLVHRMRRDSRTIPGVIMAEIWMRCRTRIQRSKDADGGIVAAPLPSIRVVTHGGRFHADDVFAFAVLRAALGPVELVRSRDPRVIAAGDIVFDVGAVHDPAARRYDHHMRERPTRSDGTPYSSVGLVWQDFGRAALRRCWLTPMPSDPAQEEAVWRDLDTGLIREIDEVDNGCAQPGQGHVAAIVETFNPSWDQPQGGDGAFLHAATLAEAVLARAAEHAWAALRAAGRVLEAARNPEDGRILVLDADLSWERTVHEAGLTELLYVVHPDEKRTTWLCRGVPVEPGSFTLRLPLPDRWAGLRDAAFSAEAGIPDGVFCHPGRFICGARSRASAIELARRSLKAAM